MAVGSLWTRAGKAAVGWGLGRDPPHRGSGRHSGCQDAPGIKPVTVQWKCVWFPSGPPGKSLLSVSLTNGGYRISGDLPRDVPAESPGWGPGATDSWTAFSEGGHRMVPKPCLRWGRCMDSAGVTFWSVQRTAVSGAGWHVGPLSAPRLCLPVPFEASRKVNLIHRHNCTRWRVRDQVCISG